MADWFDPYADPYGDSTGWTRQFGMDYDLRVFLEKGLKVVVLQRKIPILAAHNPEVVGSSPASATITSVLIGFDILQEHSFFVTHFEPVRRSHTRHDGYSR